MQDCKKVLLAILATFLVLITLLVPKPGHCNLSDMFQEMGFRVTTTEPGAYDGQTRGIATGGRLAARAPRKMIQPFTLKPPSIKGGCEGIDIFAGALSWLKADELIEMLQNIGQNAIGYAFHLGLEVVCPVCVSTLKALQNFANQINAMSTNSCQFAKALVNQGAMLLADSSINNCKASEGLVDRAMGWLECASIAEPQVKQVLRQKFEDYAPDMLVNITAGQTTGGQQPEQSRIGNHFTGLALAGQGLSDDDFQLVVSVVGTVNMENAEREDGGYGPKCVYKNPTLTLSELIEGGQVNVLTCAGQGALREGHMCESIVQGKRVIEGYLAKCKKEMMDIYETLLNEDSSARHLNQRSIAFINSIQAVPVYTALDALARLGDGPGTRAIAEAAIDRYAAAAAIDFAWETVDVYSRLVLAGAHNINSNCSNEITNLQNMIQKVYQSRFEEMTKMVGQIQLANEVLDFHNRYSRSLDASVRDNFLRLSQQGR